MFVRKEFPNITTILRSGEHSSFYSLLLFFLIHHFLSSATGRQDGHLGPKDLPGRKGKRRSALFLCPLPTPKRGREIG
jgi:hypothetical protein